MKIVAVFHGKKVEGVDVTKRMAAIAANPPLSMDGMEKIRSGLLQKIQTIALFDAIYSSRMARALDTASVIAMALNMEIQTIGELGQKGNLDSGQVIAYPGFENDDELTWQSCGLRAIAQIWMKERVGTILIVSHRPIIAGLIAAAKGINNKAGIKNILNDPNLVKDGYVVFEYYEGPEGGKLSLA